MPSCTYRALPGNVTYFLPPPTSHQSDRQYFLKHPKTKVCNTKTKSTGSPLAKKKITLTNMTPNLWLWTVALLICYWRQTLTHAYRR